MGEIFAVFVVDKILSAFVLTFLLSSVKNTLHWRVNPFCSLCPKKIISSLLVDRWSQICSDVFFCVLPRRMTAKLSPSDKVDDIMGIFELFDNDATGSQSGGFQVQKLTSSCMNDMQ